MINMRIGYVLLILSILLVCLWFTYVSVQSKEYYRRAFRMLMWAGVIMYVNHLYGISMEEGLLPYNHGNHEAQISSQNLWAMRCSGCVFCSTAGCCFHCFTR